MPRTKAQRQARRKKTGRAVLKGLNAGNRFLRKTKIISKAGKALAPLAGQYAPAVMAGSTIADAAGYGRMRGRRMRTRAPRGMKF